MHAKSGGVIDAASCTLNGINDSIIGVDSDTGGSIHVSHGSISNFTYGVRAYDHGYVNAAVTTHSGNGTDIVANENGVVNADEVTSPTTKIDSGNGSVID